MIQNSRTEPSNHLIQTFGVLTDKPVFGKTKNSIPKVVFSFRCKNISKNNRRTLVDDQIISAIAMGENAVLLKQKFETNYNIYVSGLFNETSEQVQLRIKKLRFVNNQRI